MKKKITSRMPTTKTHMITMLSGSVNINCPIMAKSQLYKRITERILETYLQSRYDISVSWKMFRLL
jgi:hypothetical protein